MKVDFLIIGGGVIGMCTAYYLQKAGHKVTVVDKGPVGKGCSFGNTGLVVPSHAHPLAQPAALRTGLLSMLSKKGPLRLGPHLSPSLLKWMFQFAKHCNATHVEYALPHLAELGLLSSSLFGKLSNQQICSPLKQTGLRMLYRDSSSFQTAQHEAVALQKVGIESQVLSRSELKDHKDISQAKLSGLISFAQDGHLDPYLFVQEITTAFKNLGGRVHELHRDIRFFVESSKIKVVSTKKSAFRPKEVIITAGAKTPELCKLLNIRVPIASAKGYSITLQSSELKLDTPVIGADSHVSIVPMGKGLTRIAGFLEIGTKEHNLVVRRIYQLVQMAQEYLPFSKYEILQEWTGMRPCTPDGLPIMSRTSTIKNLTLSAGHAMIGVSLGPASGLVTAELATGTKPSVDVRPYELSRF